MHQPSCRSRLTSMVPACAVALLLWACSSSPPPQQQPDVVMVSYTCTTPPADLAACSTDADCTTVMIGCYCGAQPVNGVTRKYATAAQGCEETAASTCALGCASEQKLMTQDGSQANIGARVAARCDRSAGTGTCKSYVPSAPSGSDDPPTGW